MAKVKVVFLLASMASMASAGCRYANPQWDMTQMSLSAPSIQVALTEQVDKIVAKWNESLISQKSQCVDKINLFADDVMLCSVAPLQQRCESASELTCGTDNLNTVRRFLLDIVIIPGIWLAIPIFTLCSLCNANIRM